MPLLPFVLLLAAVPLAAQPALEAWRDKLAGLKTNALLVVHRDKIVCEWYAPGHDCNRRQGTASLAKAIVGGTSLLAAMQDRRIRPDDLACKFIPAWKSDPLKSKITIRHLATHSSGIEDAEQDGLPHEKLSGWKGDFWRRKPDPFSLALRAPVLFEPGTRAHYSNPGMATLAYAVTASLKGAPQSDIRAVLKERVMGRLGVADEAWSIGYGQAYEVDGLKLYATWGGGAFTARATARIGQMMMHEGSFEGKVVFNSTLVRNALAYQGTPIDRRGAGDPAPGSGLCWWLNFDGAWRGVPKDAFCGAGAGQETLFVVPSLELVVVRYGNWMGPRARFWEDLVENVYAPAARIFEPAAPYPQSTVIRGIRFAPESTVTRAAMDSDNFPITWADDDAQYTSFGDGYGFEPFIKEKLSMGISKLTGGPENFKAVNLRAPTIERPGDGKRGPKASGMLMVDGVLYMWVRNTDNSQLVWSEDHGLTWQWGFKFDVSFGSPAFLNFGGNYAGARDGYVYSYSQDGPSAYESYDGVVLARVPKGKMRDRAAYEFFVRLDAAGKPEWTRDIARRGPVFTFPGKCQRVDAVYNPGLKRYLLAVGYNHNGGWGIYDAPEPWGPWTTAFQTAHWGLGGTHGYRLPSKWISPDGRTMHLVFSGIRPNDAFCIRRMELDAAR